MVGVIFKVVPLPANVPPQETVYHFHDASELSVPPDSVSETAVPEQTVRDGVPDTVVAAVDWVLITIIVVV